MTESEEKELKKIIVDQVFVAKAKDRSGLQIEGNKCWLFDFSRVLLRPSFIDIIGKVFWDKYKDSQSFQIGCLEVAGIPLAVGLSNNIYHRQGILINTFFIRKSRKKHDSMNMIEGIVEDQRVILVDDIINTGNSFIRQVEVIESLGKKVDTIFSILRYRDESYYEYFHKKNIKVVSLFAINDFSESLGLTNLKSPAVKPVAMPFSVKWYFKSENPNFFYVVPKSAPAVDDRNIYFGSDSGYFWSLDQHDGSVLWKYKVGLHAKGKSIFSSPVINDELVFFGAYDGNVYALDKKTGLRKWVFMEADWVGSSPAIAKKINRLFIGLEFGLINKRGGIVSLEASSGKKIWEYTTKDYVHASPAYSEKRNILVCGSNNNSVYALDAEKGSLIWEFKTEAEVKASISFDDRHDIACFGSHDSFLYIVDLRSGRLINKIKTGEGIYSNPLIYRDKIYVSSLDKKLYCVDLNSFKIHWEFNTNGRIFASPSVINDLIYIGSNDGRLYELNPDTGLLSAQFQAVERITNSIVSSKDGSVIFLPTFANEIICLSDNRNKHYV